MCSIYIYESEINKAKKQKVRRKEVETVQFFIWSGKILIEIKHIDRPQHDLQSKSIKT